MVKFLKDRWEEYGFLLQELVKRDFKKKYKKTALGMLWSLLNPLLRILVMYLVFSVFFGNETPHFLIHVFSGQMIFGFFSNGTNSGMTSLVGNAELITKVKVPKYIFLFSKNAASTIEFFTTLIIFFVFVWAEGIAFTPRMFLLIYPVTTLLIFNIGVGLILSAVFVFFKDTQYLYSVFLQLLMFMSAIFWPVERFSYSTQRLFMINPIFAHIHYFRLVVIHNITPSVNVHLLLFGNALLALAVGSFFYKKYSYKFVYYI